MPNLGGWEFVILIGLLVLVFGAKRLPDMARSIGQSARVFKGEMKGMKGDEGKDGKDGKAEKPAAPAPPAALPPTQPAATPPAAQATPPEAPPSQEIPQEPTRVTQPGHSSTGQ